MRFLINQNNKECLYTSIQKDEHITTSLFITDGSNLKARMIVQGPIVSKQVINSSAEVLAAGLRFDKASKNELKNLALNVDTDVDFEHLYDDVDEESIEDDDFEHDDDYYLEDDVDDALLEEYYYYDDDFEDDDYEFMEDDAMTEEEKEELRKAKEEHDKMTGQEKMAIKRKNMEEKRKAHREALQRREENKKRREKLMMEKDRKRARHIEDKKKKSENMNGLDKLRAGEPLQKTFMAREEGWYRFCVSPLDEWVSTNTHIRKRMWIIGNIVEFTNVYFYFFIILQCHVG